MAIVDLISRVYLYSAGYKAGNSMLNPPILSSKNFAELQNP